MTDISNNKNILSSSTPMATPTLSAPLPISPYWYADPKEKEIYRSQVEKIISISNHMHLMFIAGVIIVGLS